MKKLLITLSVALVCVGAFAQGKIAFSNDNNHLAYFTSDTAGLNAADAAVAGQGVYTTTIGSLEGSPSIVADLWAGTASDALQMVTSGVGWFPVSGIWVPTNVELPSGLPAGAVTYFQVNIHDASVADAAAAWAEIGKYGGVSDVFTAVPGPSTYPAMWSSAAQSTWAAGTFPVVDSSGFGAVEVYATVPEPSMFALAGLGIASLLIFRRRK